MLAGFVLASALLAAALTAACQPERTVAVQAGQNDSYVFGNLSIPAASVFSANYTLENGTVVAAAEHWRTCICEFRRCLRICSLELVEFYESEEDKEIIDPGYQQNLTLASGEQQELHLMHDFHHITGGACQRSYKEESNEDPVWILYENGSLWLEPDNVQLGPDDFCMDMIQFRLKEEYRFYILPFDCTNRRGEYWSLTAKSYAMAFSLPFFVVTIALYCWIPYLRRGYGKCFICYLTALTLSYALLSYLQLANEKVAPLPCRLIGYVTYFAIIAYLTWTCIISHNVLNSFRDGVRAISFLRYSLVGWSAPALMTALTAAAQEYLASDALKPGIDETSCGVNTKYWSACIYLYIPCLLVMIYSLTLYVKVLRLIARSKRSIRMHTKNLRKSQLHRFFLYFRIFIFMGVSWFFDILSYLLKMLVHKEAGVPMFAIPDMFNASQGLFIFVVFICRDVVIRKICERCRGRRAKRNLASRTSTMEMY